MFLAYGLHVGAKSFLGADADGWRSDESIAESTRSLRRQTVGYSPGNGVLVIKAAAMSNVLSRWKWVQRVDAEQPSPLLLWQRWEDCVPEEGEVATSIARGSARPGGQQGMPTWLW